MYITFGGVLDVCVAVRAWEIFTPNYKQGALYMLFNVTCLFVYFCRTFTHDGLGKVPCIALVDFPFSIYLYIML